MLDRLSSLDVSFLYLEESTTPMHVGSVSVFEAPADASGEGLGYETLLTLVRERLAYVPRYRQRVRWVPGHLANPVWVDDESFDLTFHVRRSAIPRPGTPERLRELVARLMSRPLDRNRPLWEMYLVEGLAPGDADAGMTRFALVSKTHQAVVDGLSAVDIGQVVLDPTPEPVEAPAAGWQPGREPSPLELVAGAVAEVVARPSALVDTARSAVSDAQATAGRLYDLAGSAAGDLARALRVAARPAPGSPLNVPIGPHRRFETVDTRLEDFRGVRARLGGSVNDAILATIAGALRTWLFTRGVPVRPTTTVRALVPMSIVEPTVEPTEEPERTSGAEVDPDLAKADGYSGPRGVGSRVAEWVVELPVGEPSPAMRLHQVSYAMKAHAETGQAVGARAMVGMAGFAPPTLHALGARLASSLSRREFNLVVTNVPGPQTPLYLAGSRMVATYPFVPLAKGQALAIGLTSYAGAVRFGLNADREALADVQVLAEAIPDALAELVDTPAARPPRRPPDRKRAPATQPARKSTRKPPQKQDSSASRRPRKETS